MGRNRISLWIAAGLLLAAGCAKKSDFETSRKRLIEDQRLERSATSYTNAKMPAILPRTFYAAGRMFEAQGNLPKAIEQYRKAIAAGHGHVPSYHRLGLVYSRAGRHDESIEMFRKAVELDPGNPVLHNNLGFELMFKKDWGGAVAQFDTAIEKQPRFARAHINLGMALSKLGRFDDALDHFRRVLPEPDAQYNLGLMYRAARKYQEAAETFKCILESDPNFDAAKTQLADIAPLIPDEGHSGVEAADEHPVVADAVYPKPPQSPEPAVQPTTLREFERTQRTAKYEPATSRSLATKPSSQVSSAERTPVEPKSAQTFDRLTEYEAVDNQADDDTPCDEDDFAPSAALAADWERVVPGPAQVPDSSTEHDILDDLAPWALASAADDYAEGLNEPESNEAAYASFVDTEPIASVSLADAAANVDETIHCLLDEAVEAMAVASPTNEWDEPMRIEPALADQGGTPYLVGSFIDERSAEPTAEMTWNDWNAAAGDYWRVRMRKLDHALQTVRSEIDCLQTTDEELSTMRQAQQSPPERPAPDARVITVSDRPGEHRQEASPKPRSSQRSTPMIRSYRPAKKQRDRQPHASTSDHAQAVPATIARPNEAYSVYAQVDDGPAFPEYGIVPTARIPSRTTSRWDREFTDLRDLLSIVQNELRCREEKELSDDQVSSDAFSTDGGDQDHYGRAMPVRIDERHNPFNRR